MSQSPLQGLWLRWKSLRLPWRRKWIAGRDLTGIVFYEHRFNPLSATKPRRTAAYPYAIHPGDIALTPAWIQWLRNTRPEPPSIDEQRYDLRRQAQMKQLAAAADERWAEKPSFLDKPRDTARGPAEVLEPGDRGGHKQVDSQQLASVVVGEEEAIHATKGEDATNGRLDRETIETADAPKREERTAKENPWRKTRGAPSEEWQPSAWTPGNVGKR